MSKLIVTHGLIVPKTGEKFKLVVTSEPPQVSAADRGGLAQTMKQTMATDTGLPARMVDLGNKVGVEIQRDGDSVLAEFDPTVATTIS